MAKKTGDILQNFIEVFKTLEGDNVFASRTDAGLKLDVSPQVITEILKGRMKPPLPVLQKLFKDYDVNPRFIFLGEYPARLSSGKNSQNAQLIAQPNAQLKDGLVEYGKEIPMVKVEALGGISNATFRIEAKDIKAMYVIPDFSGADFMMRVKGSSMYPKYNSGDVIACRILKEVSFIQWGKVYVIATKEQGILVKRLKKSVTKTHLVAVSDNASYEPFEIPRKDIFGYALVVGVVRLE